MKKKVTACVIGSGAGGGVVAKELAEKGISVVVLEAGRRLNPLQDYTTALRDWERAGREDHLFSVPEMDRVTFGRPGMSRPYEALGVGGTTLRYLAYMVRLTPEDFRTYSMDGIGADWPIMYEDLARHYRKVETEMQVSGLHGDPWSLWKEPFPQPPFEMSYRDSILKRGFDKLGLRLWPVPVARLSRPFRGRPACVNCGECEHGCMTGAKSSIDVTYIAKAEATGKVEVRPESRVTRIAVDPRGRARGVIYFDRNGSEHMQEADIIILSAGSVQSPRLLLNSKSALFPDGLANSSGLVGKYFMQHVSIVARAIFPERIDSFRGFSGGLISKDHAKTSPGNNFARGWVYELSSGVRGPAQMALSLPGWGASHKDRMRKTFGHMAGLAMVGEQLPEEKNRIELDPKVKDAYGMPVPRMTLGLSENDRSMLEAMKKHSREVLHSAGATEIELAYHRLGASSHNMGGCRMGKEPKTSVLNSYCQCHDVPNLFVIDASCFVTGGTANPSLTIMAIATRAAGYIADQGKKGGVG
ncbi:MAG: GMC family oxidoreductase [Nitrospirota bacterium]|nr:GMC family oxidoreductase [Nitrospirota bacterium]